MKIEPRPMVCSCGRIHAQGQSCDSSGTPVQNNEEQTRMMKYAYEEALKKYGPENETTCALKMNLALMGNDPVEIEKAAEDVRKTHPKDSVLHLQALFISLQSRTDRGLRNDSFALLDDIFALLDENIGSYTKEAMMDLAGSAGMFMKAFGEKDALKYIDRAIAFSEKKEVTESEGYALLLSAKAHLLDGSPLTIDDAAELMEKSFLILSRTSGYDNRLTMQVLEDLMDLYIQIKTSSEYVDAFMEKVLSGIEDRNSDTFISYALTPGAYYINSGAYERAISIANEYMEKTGKTSPLHLQSIYLRALAEQTMGNHRAALRSFTKLKESAFGYYRDESSQMGTVLTGIAYNAEKLGKYELAATTIEELIARNAPAPSLGTKLDVLIKLREIYTLSGHNDLAMEIDRAMEENQIKDK